MNSYHVTYKSPLQILIFVFLCLIVTSFSCVDLDSNPIASDYKGDYQLEVDFSSLPDTLDILTSYPLEWESGGVDSFYHISVSTAQEDLVVQPDERLPAPFPLYFTEPFTGRITVHGIKPNSSSLDTISDTLVICNPYRIMVDSAALFSVDTLACHVSSIRTGREPDSSLSVVWQHDEQRDTLPAYRVFQVEAFTGDTLILTSALIDTFRNRYSLPPCTLVVPDKIIPHITVKESLLIAPAGAAVTLIASATDADSLLWSVQSLHYDTITSEQTLSFVWPDTVTDTVIITAVNRFNIQGNRDTIIVHVEKNDLELSLLSFPTAVKTTTFSDWIVEARRNGERVHDSDVIYLWDIVPEQAADSIVISGGTLSLLPRREYDRFSVTITAIIDNDTLFPRSATVTVTSDRPSISLVNRHDAADIGDTVWYIVHTSDTNDSGTVDSVFFRTDTDTAVTLLASDTVPVAFSVAGIHTLAFWCSDNDGFYSDTVSTTLTVASQNPWFTSSRLDTAVFIDDSVLLHAEAVHGDSGETIETWLWDFDRDEQWDTVTSTGYINVLFTVPETTVIITACVDDQGDTSKTFRETRLFILAGEPVVTGITPRTSTHFSGDTVEVTITADDPNGTVDSLGISFDTSYWYTISVTPSPSIDTTLLVPLPDIGMHLISVHAIDNRGMRSAPYQSPDTIHVSDGRPVVSGIAPDTCWIFDTVSFTLAASDPNDAITTYRVQWNEEGEWKESTDSVSRRIFSTGGTQIIRCSAVNDRNETSDTLTDSIYVREGKPSVTISAEYDSAWIFDEVPFTVSGEDPNGVIRKRGIIWDEDSDAEINNNNGTFTHAFSSEGAHAIRAFTLDDDGISSDTVTVSFFVKNSSPVITGLYFSVSPDSLFIRDSLFLTIKAADVNGTIDSLFVYRGGDEPSLIHTVAAYDDSAVCSLVFQSGDTGSQPIHLKITDDDGMTADTTTTLHIRTGIPKITSVSCDASPLWIMDTNFYQISVMDTNGIIRKLYAIWNGGDTPDDSISIENPRSAIDTFFTHSWDTTGGLRTVRFSVVDDDGLQSPWVEKTFDVHKGAPVVKGTDHGDSIQWKKGTDGSLDTMFYIYQGGDVPVIIDTADSNGDVITIEWDVNGDGVNQSGQELFYTLNSLDPHTPKKMTVVAIDNDEIRSEPYTFWIYADEPPPVTTTTSDASEGVRIIRWSGKDEKDGNNTQYKIVAKIGTASDVDSVTVADESNATYIVSDFKAGTNYDADAAFDFKFTYTPNQGSGVYHYRIIARDARGAESRTTGDPLFLF